MLEGYEIIDDAKALLLNTYLSPEFDRSRTNWLTTLIRNF